MEERKEPLSNSHVISPNDLFRFRALLKIMYNLDGNYIVDYGGHSILGFKEVDSVSGNKYKPEESPTAFVLEKLAGNMPNSAYGITYWIDSHETSITTSIYQFIIEELSIKMCQRLEKAKGVALSKDTFVSMIIHMAPTNNCIRAAWLFYRNNILDPKKELANARKKQKDGAKL